jgi:AraC family transcriptional regulator, regulatory protein of adaptative response / DNA-3-methyladenine glycosylase II
MDLDADACYRAVSTRDRRFDGLFFVAVVTTGVYCRPICPARTPKRENVLFYRSAAAAQEAGFRPCLRCRPDTSPHLALWRGTSNTVSRALLLVEAGALEGGDVEDLANRVGVGERQLRRLFMRHLGASPLAVAQTRRVLLAKQLIHDTRLSLAEVALAAGFGSVRRFNATFQRLYGRPPSSLRRKKGPNGLLATGELKLRLAYRPPYDWTAMLSFLGQRAIPGIEVVSGNTYGRTLAVGAHHGSIFVEPGDGPFVQATIRFPRLAALPAIIARVRRVFDLAADPVVIGAHLAEDPLLAPMVALRPGLRVPGAWDGFELSARAILGQQVTVSRARRLAGKLSEALGESLDDARANALGLTHLFPEPGRVANADLSMLGMPRARVKALQSLAAALVEDPSLLTPGHTLEETIARLRALEGVGEWTAQYIALRELREPDAFPAGDAGLMRALFLAEGRRPASRELHARAERWRPWRAYAAMHLWASLPAGQSRAAMPPPSGSWGETHTARLGTSIPWT